MGPVIALFLLGILQVAHILDIMVPEIVKNLADYILRLGANLLHWMGIWCHLIGSNLFDCLKFWHFSSLFSSTKWAIANVGARRTREALVVNLVQKRMAGMSLDFESD
jgi:hypothetical protein